jgi:DNA-binding IclR family transcriptional regulator
VPRLTPALARGLDIVELFLTEDRPLSAPEIARRTGLPRTTVHELLGTLVARSYLVRDELGGHYRLGLRLFQLGNAYAERFDLVTAATGVARRVCAECNETVHVAVREGRNVVYIAKVDSTRAVRMVSAVGRTLPAHCTAVGKALLAGLSEAELAELYPEGARLVAFTEHSITTVPRLRAEIRDTIDRGLSVDECESNPDVCCLGAAVRDHLDRVVAAMSISVPENRWTEANRAGWERLLVEGARELSKQLGQRSAAGEAALPGPLW